MSAVRESRRYPWYDAWWLHSYAEVKRLIGEKYPERLSEFIDAFEPVRTRPEFSTIEIRNVLDDDLLQRLRETIRALPAQALEKHEFFRFGRHVVHDLPLLTEIQAGLVELVGRHVGQAVEPTYNFLSLYNNFGVCELHLDAPIAKWTLDVCVDQSRPWPIQISEVCPWPEDEAFGSDWERHLRADPRIRFHEYSHSVGSALLFSGSSQWHGRVRISEGGQQNYSHLAFFHFAPAGSRSLIDPREWPALFGIAEIAGVISVPVKVRR